MSIRGDQLTRLLLSIHRGGKKGKTEPALLYFELRFHQLGEEFTLGTLEDLVTMGMVKRSTDRTRGYKTISEKEKKEVTRYTYVKTPM